MELYFLRHGIAAPLGGSKYKDDSLRPLTAEGIKKTRRASLGMRALGLKFDAVLSSPYLRARQTAEIAAGNYKIKIKKIYITNNLLPPASIENLLKEIHNHFPKSKNILLVGHEPHLSTMISSLLKCGKLLVMDFKKGGLCSVTVEPPLSHPAATLNWLLTPSQLELMAGKS
jgi:phosphohistidine phosphatase